MSDHFYNDQLYPLQDQVLTLINENKTSFYLTGGTVFGRFMLHHRYSDLDFFVNNDPDFRLKVDKLISVLEKKFKDIIHSVKEDGFVRLYIPYQNFQLKIEFINDVAYRVGNPILNDRGFLCDTWENILSNKISALSRNAAKDFVDILFLCLVKKFNWESMIMYAKAKDSWVEEIEVSRTFINFNMEKLKEVKFANEFDAGRIKPDYFKLLARESLHGLDNSLFEQTF